MTAMLAILVGQIVAGWLFDHRFTDLGGSSDAAWQAALGPLAAAGRLFGAGAAPRLDRPAGARPGRREIHARRPPSAIS